MRYPAAEKLEVIRLVERSYLPAKQALDMLDIPRTTFYRWYARYRRAGQDALRDKTQWMMDDAERRALGEETIKKVYAGDVVTPPEGYLSTDVMLKQLFAEVWTQEKLRYATDVSYCSVSLQKKTNLKLFRFRPRPR